MLFIFKHFTMSKMSQRSNGDHTSSCLLCVETLLSLCAHYHDHKQQSASSPHPPFCINVERLEGRGAVKWTRVAAWCRPSPSSNYKYVFLHWAMPSPASRGTQRVVLNVFLIIFGQLGGAHNGPCVFVFTLGSKNGT